MNERKLTPEQIEELHEFCIYRSIWHYDVQVELVDHLASAIEEIWETNQQLSFQDALYEVDQKFGSHPGFVIIRQEKEKALRKKYRRLLWQFVADYYKFPKIMVTFSLFLGIFTAIQLSANDQWIVGSLVTLFIGFAIYYTIYFFPRHIKIKVPGKHTFFFNEIALKGVLSKTIMFSGGITGNILQISDFSIIQNLIFSALISCYIVLLNADCFIIPKKIHEHFREQFPQFQLA